MSGGIDFSEYVAAGLVELAKQLDGGIAHKIDDVPGLFESRFDHKLPDGLLVEALDILRDCGIGYVDHDPLAGNFVRISEEKFDNFVNEIEDEARTISEALHEVEQDKISFDQFEEIKTPYSGKLKKYVVLDRYIEFGRPYIESALEKALDKDFQERLARDQGRVFDFSDNMDLARKIISELEEARELAELNNEVVAELGDNREQVVVEIAVLQKLMAGTQVRVAYLADLSRRSLAWIGSVAGKTALQEVVKRLMKHFLEMLS